MASHFYTAGLARCFDGTIDVANDTLKLMLVQDTYTPDKDHEFVGTDLDGHELTVSGYDGGYGGTSRQVVGITVQTNLTDDRVEFVLDDVVWENLSVGETLGGAVLIKEITNDNASPMIAFFDVTDTPTNSGSITIDFASAIAGGNLRINV